MELQEKTLIAKQYIEKLANGINPLTDEELPEGDIVNNVRISRCLFFVAELLEKNLTPAAAPKAKKPRKENYTVSSEELERFELSDEPLPVTLIAEKFNSLVDPEKVKKMTTKKITEWLISLDLLELVQASDSGPARKLPTQYGRDTGIFTQERISVYGKPYTIVLYSKQAQKFIVDNVDSLLLFDEKEEKEMP